MAWPLTTTPATSYYQMAATDLLQALQKFYDPCTLIAFPGYATMYQTAVLHRAMSEQLLPLSYDGALTFIVGYGGPRPAAVQQVWNEVFVSAPVQTEQRLTSGGQNVDSNLSTWLFQFYGWKWAGELIAAGGKSCYLDSRGWTKADGVAFCQARMSDMAALLPPGLFDAGEFVQGVTTPIRYVPGTLPAVEIPDDPNQGGPGTHPIGGSSISRPDDKYYYPDGTIRTVQGIVIGYFDPNDGAPKPLPSDVNTVYGAGGSQVTTDGTGRVVSSSPPGGSNVQTLYSPAAPPPEGWAGTVDAAGSPAPIISVAPIPGNVLPGTNPVTGRPATDSSPGSGGGTATAPISAVLIDGAPAGVGATAPVFQVPTWAIAVGGVALLLLLLPGGRR